MNQPQPNGVVPEVAWQVEWNSPIAGPQMVQRREEWDALMMARDLREKGGLQTKLYRVEKTEIVF